MRNVARVDDERGLFGHFVHEVNGPGEGAIDIGVSVFIESYVSVADVHEQRFTKPCGSWFTLGCHGEIQRREHTARQSEEDAGPAIGPAFEGVATRVTRSFIRHVGLHAWCSGDGTLDRVALF